MKYSLNIKDYFVLLIWGVLFTASVTTLFVFTHELTHVIRFDEPVMMCLGFGDNFGLVERGNVFTEEQYNHEELMANIISSIICLIYMSLTFYIIYFQSIKFNGGKIKCKQKTEV